MTVTNLQQQSAENKKPALQRRLSLPLLTLYGLGVTVGAGIYVLVGATAAKAGVYAPVSFLLAAAVVAFTCFTYSELSTRFPVSAGEAAYVRSGFNSRVPAMAIGLMVAASGVVSSAAISIGASAYLEHLVPLPPAMLTILITLVLGLIAAWGILESVAMAAIITLIEIGGLCFVVFYGFTLQPDLLSEIGRLVPPLEIGAWTGIVSAGLLAFFAFVGFEDMANVAEEVKDPSRNMPKAIVLTLVVATAIYLAVVSVVILTVPMDLLVGSSAPLILVFENAGDTTKGIFNSIAALATINGVLIQMIMASRVLYGLASQGNLPKKLAYVNPITHTPLVATGLVVAIILGLALFFPISKLAETTSLIVLIVFMTVNLALIRIKLSRKPVTDDIFQVPLWVPLIGFVTCLMLLFSGLI
ncbi:MAG: amino acid permease [Hyphomicrobiales bacterium]|nr:amino acid permease [Hyphomicrobiales bacterium]